MNHFSSLSFKEQIVDCQHQTIPPSLFPLLASSLLLKRNNAIFQKSCGESFPDVNGSENGGKEGTLVLTIYFWLWSFVGSVHIYSHSLGKGEISWYMELLISQWIPRNSIHFNAFTISHCFNTSVLYLHDMVCQKCPMGATGK